MGEYIKITHFINPHLFWFKLTKSPEFTEIRTIDTELNKHFQNIQDEIKDTPKEHDKVAVKYLPFKRYIRAEVKKVLHNPNHTDEYIVWANDYGFPVKTSASFMHPLPSRFADYPNYVYRGGIANILPGIREMEPFVERFVFNRQSNWSQYACEALEGLLRTASSVRFAKNSLIVGSDHWWGELQIKDQHGQRIVVSEYLANLHCGLLVQTDFLDKLGAMCTTKIPMWNTNNGNMNCKMNAHSETPKAINGDTLDDIHSDDSKMQRVVEWIKSPKDPRDCDESSIPCTDAGSVMTTDDIHFEDSISEKQMPATKTSEAKSNEFQNRLQKARSKSLYAGKSLYSSSSSSSNTNITVEKGNNSPKPPSVCISSSTQSKLAEKRIKMLERAKRNSMASETSQKENINEKQPQNVNQAPPKNTTKSVLAPSNTSTPSQKQYQSESEVSTDNKVKASETTADSYKQKCHNASVTNGKAESVVSDRSEKTECSAYAQKLLAKRQKFLSTQRKPSDASASVENAAKSQTPEVQASPSKAGLTQQKQKLLDRRLKLLGIYNNNQPSAMEKVAEPAAVDSVTLGLESPFQPNEKVNNFI